jgi:hypothetical protein
MGGYSSDLPVLGRTPTFSTVSAQCGPRLGRSERQLFASFPETHHKTEILRRWFREAVLRYRSSQVNAVLPQEIVYLRNDLFQ